jgi:vacuolar-type H+-ATPase subunit H
MCSIDNYQRAVSAFEQSIMVYGQKKYDEEYNITKESLEESQKSLEEATKEAQKNVKESIKNNKKKFKSSQWVIYNSVNRVSKDW